MTASRFKKLFMQVMLFFGVAVLAVFSLRASKSGQPFFKSLAAQVTALFNGNGGMTA
jgi:hypothetical protein